MKVFKSLKYRVIKIILMCLPYSFIVKNYTVYENKKSKNLEIWKDVYIRRFYKNSPLAKNFDDYINKARTFDKYCFIKAGNWDYKIINFCFIKEMISNIIWSLERGYKPIIDIKVLGQYGSHTSNLWEQMFIQPFAVDSGYFEKNPDTYIVCPIRSHCIIPNMQDARNSQRTQFWNKVFSAFLKYNTFCEKYIEEEVDSLLKEKRCLGCLIRGTDYTKTQPQGHPIQPEIDELINQVEKIMHSEKLEYIYLATEEKKFADVVKEKFGDIVIENKRQYFDVQFDSNNLYRISQVCFNRENDDFWKSLEYISSINILSQCHSLVAGLCGGSEAAVYMNGNKYQTKYLFDKGTY